MYWNYFMHGFIGYFGTGWFTFSPKGIIYTLLIAIATQGVDVFRVRKEYLKKNENNPKAAAELNRVLAQTFMKNTAICSAITIFVSEFARSNNWGI